MTVRTTLVDPDRPARRGFAGSPTLFVNGENPFASAARQDMTAACSLDIPTIPELQSVLGDRA